MFCIQDLSELIQFNRKLCSINKFFNSYRYCFCRFKLGIMPISVHKIQYFIQNLQDGYTMTVQTIIGASEFYK